MEPDYPDDDVPRRRRNEDIQMGTFNEGYQAESLPHEYREQGPNYMARGGDTRIPMDTRRRYSDSHPGTYGDQEHGSSTGSRRNWATTEGLRDTAELLSQLPSRQFESLANDVANQGRKTLRHRRKTRRSYHGSLRMRDPDRQESFRNRLENDEDFREDFIDGLDGDAIRDMPTQLSQKKELRHMTLQRSSKRRKKPGFGKRMKYSCGIQWMHFKYRVSEMVYYFELWKSLLKKIEGHFGTGVTSYFLFLKWIFLLNIPIFIMTLGFVVIPQVLWRWKHGGYSNMQTFNGTELITGRGWFDDTELYYGYYTDMSLKYVGNAIYEMKYAYLLTCGGYYILCLIILALSISRSYKKNYIEGNASFNFYYVSRVFCAWDYGITSPDAKRLKHKSFYNEMKEFLAGKKEKVKTSMGNKCKWFFIRVLTNLLVLASIGGLSYLIYWISSNKSIKTNTPILGELAMPLCVSGINFFFPFIFSLVASIERYEKPRNELYVNMIRTMLLKASILGMLVYFWFHETVQEECWETVVGGEIYRLVLVDFIFILVTTFFMEFIRRLMADYCCNKSTSDDGSDGTERSVNRGCSRPEFDIGRNTLDLIYSQTLCWLGTYYSPLLSLIVIIKFFIIFYVKAVSVLQNCRPSLRPWRAARSHTIFLGFLFVFFLLSAAAVTFGIIMIKPSVGCGPFRGKDKAYSIVTDLVDSWNTEIKALHEIINFISSPGFIAGVLVFLCVVTYYMRIVMVGHKEMVTLLKQQLAMEGRDKAYLLQMLQNVSRKNKNMTKPASSQGRLLSPGSVITDDRSPAISRTATGGRRFVKTMAEAASAAGTIDNQGEDPRNRRRRDQNGAASSYM